MRVKSESTIYSREGIWYGSYYSHGKRKQRSTGVKDDRTKAAQTRARNVVTGWIGQEKADALLQKPDAVVLQDFARGFFDWDGQYLVRQRAKDIEIGRAWARERQRHVANHIIPGIGTKLLSELTLPMVERWLISLPLAGGTRNSILYTLKTILDEAVAEKLLERSPLDRAKPFGTKNAVKRDVLTLDELKLLFPADDAKALEVWKPERKSGMSARECLTLMYTMSKTGIRVGEARALLWRHVLPGGWLHVERAVKADGSMGPTKAREVRVVPLESGNQLELAKWRAESLFPEPDALVFYGLGPDKPINKHTFGDVFSRGLANAGISTEGRVLVVHSLRHGYNTSIRRAAPLEAVQLMVGHKSEALSDRYTHEGPEALIAALEPERKKVEAALAW